MARRPPDSLLPNGLAGWLSRALPARLIAALVLYVLVSVAVFGGTAAYVIGQRLAERDAREAELLHELERREITRHALESALVQMRQGLDAHEMHIATIERDHAELDRSFRQAEAERAALEDERNLARERARLLDRGARETELWLETAQRERLALERERAALETRLTEVDEARALAERREQGLRWRLETKGTRLAQLEADREATASWLAEWIGGRLDAIETVLQRTGLEPDRLLARAANGLGTGSKAGIGGPLLPLVEPASTPAILGLGTPLVHGLATDIDRLEAAERLLAAVPLASPFDHYHQTSRFGPRTDPITRRQALHNGLDFGAPTGSEVLATAPGRITHAGRAGSYGIMVEIDHGHGITTRYAHLSRTLVEPGDRSRCHAAFLGSAAASSSAVRR